MGHPDDREREGGTTAYQPRASGSSMPASFSFAVSADSRALSHMHQLDNG